MTKQTMKKNDLISIIIPAYNSENYVSECIDSVINQTYKNIEIVIINDGSTDNTLSIIQGYQKKDKRIVLINQKNMGVYESRCNGIRVAHGKYITFLDADDLLTYDCIEVMYNSIKKYNSNIVRCNFKYLSNKGYVTNKLKVKNGSYSKKDIYHYYYHIQVQSS